METKKWTRPVVIDCLVLFFLSLFLSISPACRIPSHPIFLWQTFIKEIEEKSTRTYIPCYVFHSLFLSRRIIRSVSIPFRWKRRRLRVYLSFFFWSVCYIPACLCFFFFLSFVCKTKRAIVSICFLLFFCTCVCVIQPFPVRPDATNSLARPYLKLSQFNLQYSESLSLFL